MGSFCSFSTTRILIKKNITSKIRNQHLYLSQEGKGEGEGNSNRRRKLFWGYFYYFKLLFSQYFFPLPTSTIPIYVWYFFHFRDSIELIVVYFLFNWEGLIIIKNEFVVSFHILFAVGGKGSRYHIFNLLTLNPSSVFITYIYFLE